MLKNKASIVELLVLLAILGFIGILLSILALQPEGGLLLILPFYGGIGLAIIGSFLNGLTTWLNKKFSWPESRIILVGDSLLIGGLLWCTIQCSTLIVLG